MYINDAYFWQHEEDMFTDLFQPPRMIYYNILMEISSHIYGGMIHILLSTWSYFMKVRIFQPPLCSDFGEHSCVKSTLEHSYGVVIHPGKQVIS
jgi:hypothetical protein